MLLTKVGEMLISCDSIVDRKRNDCSHSKKYCKHIAQDGGHSVSFCLTYFTKLLFLASLYEGVGKTYSKRFYRVDMKVVYSYWLHAIHYS